MVSKTTGGIFCQRVKTVPGFSNSFFNESYHKISANAILSSSNSLINLYPEFETYEIRENIDDPLTDNKLTLSLFELP